MSSIRVYITEKNITTLGPGNRFGLWVQGCNRKCRGCVAEASRDHDGGRLIDTGALAWEIICSGADGITISGGEPFLQAKALSELIATVQKHADMGVIVYTGYLLEELDDIPFAKDLLNCTDLLIDGPYMQEYDDGKSLRGSSNQRVIALTDRYSDYLKLYGTESRKTEFFKHGNILNVVGIPNRVAPLNN